MSDLVTAIRAIVRDEMKRHLAPELGIVTEVQPRDSEGAEGNHQVNVRLRSSGVELQHVGVAVPRLGLSVLPKAGDLVVVVFLGGDLNAPLVVGSVYDAGLHPPVGQAAEVVYQPPEDEDAGVRRFHLELPGGCTATVHDDRIEIASGGTQAVIHRDGDVLIKAAGTLTLEAGGDLAISAGGNVDVSAKQNVTIQGVQVAAEAQGEAKLKGATVSLNGTTNFNAA